MPRLLRSLLLLSALIGPARAQTLHNVLIIVADDLGVDYVTAYREGSNPAPTPNIDALAKRGVLFRNAWANPSCSPTRACLMTGRYPFRTLVGRWIRYPNNSEPIGTLQAREWSLPEVLDRAQSGYAHACIGKWHINDVKEGLRTPNERGGWSHFAGTMWGQLPDYYAWPRVVNGVEKTSRVYATTQQTDDAIAWIQARKKPWVCSLNYSAPHLPLHRPPASLHTRNLTGLDPGRSPRPFYRAMIEAMDSEIGRLLKALGPALARTNVIFIGDNGSIQNLAEPPFVGSRAKGTPYEGGVNVPLVIAGPAVATPGREVSALVCAVDVFATALELAGALPALPPWVAVDGKSLVPYLKNPSQTPLRKFAFTEQFTGALWPKPNQNGHATIRNDRYKLIYRQGGSNEFYDLQNDPFENTNILKRTLSSVERQNHTALINEIGRLRAPLARFVPFGSGACKGSAGFPSIGASSLPRIGQSYTVTLQGAATIRPTLLLVGLSSRRWGALPLPLDLAALGAGPGCVLSCSGEILMPSLTSPTGSAAWRVTVPRVEALVDHVLFHTWLIADPAAPSNALGVVSTQASAAVLGS